MFKSSEIKIKKYNPAGDIVKMIVYLLLILICLGRTLLNLICDKINILLTSSCITRVFSWCCMFILTLTEFIANRRIISLMSSTYNSFKGGY